MPEAPRKRGDWQLTQASFDALLAALHADREEAGRRYERLHARLEFFFTHRQLVLADQLADEVLNRIASRLQADEPIGMIEAYAYGVARHVAQEELRRNSRDAEAKNTYMGNILPAQDTSSEEAIQAAMEDCLQQQSTADRTMLLEYYVSRGQELIEHRRQLAGALGVTPGALRKRIFRLREMVEGCVRARLARGGLRGE
jgi:DNA-directed RNA polymerase specialized sigma24 family protein